MKDFIGNELEVGDMIVHMTQRGHGRLNIGKIIRIKSASHEYVEQIQIIKLNWWNNEPENPVWVYSCDCLVKIDTVPVELRNILRLT